MRSVRSTEVPAPGGPYSQAIVVGDLAFLAGQGPFGADGKRVGETFADQVRATFENLEAVARAGGSSLHHAVRLGAYLRSLDDFPVFNEIAREYLSEPYPARTTVEVALRGFDIELDAVVAIPMV